jgi:hypothetical protein
MTPHCALHAVQYEPIVRRALEEDLGRAGDLTTDTLVDPQSQAVAHLVAREAGRVAGLVPALSAFMMLDPAVAVRCHIADGAAVVAATTLATGTGHPVGGAGGAQPAGPHVRHRHRHGAGGCGLPGDQGDGSMYPQDGSYLAHP